MSLSRNDTPDPLWRAIAGQTNGGLTLDPSSVRALADLTGAAAVAALVPGAADILDPATVRQSRLLNRFRRLQGERWAGALTAAGIPNTAIKGLATAHADWPDPDARAVSDADIVVAPADLGRALDVLTEAGFTIADMPTRGPWGFVGDASFQPLIGPQDGANIDLHVQGDAWPFARALAVEDLLAQAGTTGIPGLVVPAPTHRLLIAASHAAGDLFTADAVKSVIDGLLMLRDPGRLDFDELRLRARRGHMSRPVAAFLSLLGALGADTTPATRAGFHLPDPEAGEMGRVAAAHRTLFRDPSPGLLARLQREVLLAAGPRVVLWRNWRRISGMLRPRSGRPDRAGPA